MDQHDDYGGLTRDLRVIGSGLSRRDLIRLGAGAAMLHLLGCGGDSSGSSDGCAVIPEETAGPFPADGSNGPDVLSQSGVVRADIRSSFGSSAGTAEGVPLTVTLTVVSAANDCAPLPGYAVYLWHCDREGRYSLYSAGATDQNYLRGVQETDAKRAGDIYHDLPGVLHRSLAAHSLRGFSQPQRRDRRVQQGCHLTAGAPRSDLQ